MIAEAACVTDHGRPAFVVNVEVLLQRDGRWLVIERGSQESNSPGLFGGVGGKVEPGASGPDVLEHTARREVAEEIGVDLTGVALRYVESACFATDDGDPVVNVVFSASMPADAEPAAVSPDEVAGFAWLTLTEAEAHHLSPPWLLHSLRAAAT